jgi:hypothetical protein
VLEPYQNLGEIQEEIWKDDTVLTLRYKLASEMEAEAANETFIALPTWVDINEAPVCQICSKRFSVFFDEKFNCRNCGSVV